MFAARQIVRRSRNLQVILTGRAAFSTTGKNLSSFFEPEPNLFDHGAKDLGAAKPADAALRDDIRTMGSLLGNIIQKRQGQDVFDKVEKLRHLAKVSAVCLWVHGSMNRVLRLIVPGSDARAPMT
jgi:hypothetical protein